MDINPRKDDAVDPMSEGDVDDPSEVETRSEDAEWTSVEEGEGEP